jgi:predicted phosphoribosyltransferase
LKAAFHDRAAAGRELASKVLPPWNTESGYGAVAFDGSVWIDAEAASRYSLGPTQIDKGIAIAALRKHAPAEIVVAVPTAHERSIAAIRKHAAALLGL